MTVATAAIPTLTAKRVAVAGVPVAPLDDFRESPKEQLTQGSAAVFGLFCVPAGPQTLGLYDLTILDGILRLLGRIENNHRKSVRFSK